MCRSKTSLRRLVLLQCATFAGCFAPKGVWADSMPKNHWPGWLGPRRDGWVDHFQPPRKWPTQPQKVWERRVGTGYGTPLVVGNRVFQHARHGENEVVWCLRHSDGNIVWRKEHPTPFQIGGGGQYHGKGPKACPTYSDGRLFTMSITGVLTARDAASGRLLWRRDLSARFKKLHPYWGASGSPIVDGRQVIAHFGTDGQGALIAHDAATGHRRWSHGKDGPSYASPLVVTIDGVRQVIDWNERVLAGIDAGSGKFLWEVPAKQSFTDQNMPTPVFHDGMILLGAENRGVRAIRPRLRNGTWTATALWHQKSVALNMSTAVINKGYLYGLSHYGRGRLFCLDPKTGRVLWQGPPRTAQHATLLAVPGYVAALLNNGRFRVFRADPRNGYARVAEYRVSSTATWAPPVLLNDSLLVKDRDTLMRWSLRRAK